MPLSCYQFSAAAVIVYTNKPVLNTKSPTMNPCRRQQTPTKAACPEYSYGERVQHHLGDEWHNVLGAPAEMLLSASSSPLKRKHINTTAACGDLESGFESDYSNASVSLSKRPKLSDPIIDSAAAAAAESTAHRQLMFGVDPLMSNAGNTRQPCAASMAALLVAAHSGLDARYVEHNTVEDGSDSDIGDLDGLDDNHTTTATSNSSDECNDDNYDDDESNGETVFSRVCSASESDEGISATDGSEHRRETGDETDDNDDADDSDTASMQFSAIESDTEDDDEGNASGDSDDSDVELMFDAQGRYRGHYPVVYDDDAVDADDEHETHEQHDDDDHDDDADVARSIFTRAASRFAARLVTVMPRCTVDVGVQTESDEERFERDFERLDVSAVFGMELLCLDGDSDHLLAFDWDEMVEA